MRNRIALFAGVGALALILVLVVAGYFYWMSISSVCPGVGRSGMTSSF